MSDVLKLQLPISMQDILKIWARQAGFFEKSVPPEAQEIKYMTAMLELLGMLAKHHEEMDDATFIRSFRFFRDAGLTKRLSADTYVFKRAAKLESIEPDTTTQAPAPTPIIAPPPIEQSPPAESGFMGMQKNPGVAGTDL